MLLPITVEVELRPRRERPRRSLCLVARLSVRCSDSARQAFSIRQQNLTPLDLIVAKTSRDLAIWTDDGRITGDRNPQVRIVTLTDGFLKCDKPCAQ
jgi:hypothetical protein